MEFWKTFAPIIAAFIAALIGSFFGALFKEQLTERFNKRRRRRELRHLIIKDVVVFFKKLMAHADLHNSIEYHKHRVNILQSLKSGKHLTDAEKGQIQDDIEGMFKYLQQLGQEDMKLAEQGTQIEANLIALSIEADSYFGVEQSKKIQNLILEISRQGGEQNIGIHGYESLEYFDLLDWHGNHYTQLVKAIQNKLDDQMTFYIREINSILR